METTDRMIWDFLRFDHFWNWCQLVSKWIDTISVLYKAYLPFIHVLLVETACPGIRVWMEIWIPGMSWDQWCAEVCRDGCRINVSVVCGVARAGVVDKTCAGVVVLDACAGVVVNKTCVGLVVMDAFAGVVVNKTCVGLVVMDAFDGVVVNKTCVGLVVMDACAGVVVRDGCASSVVNAFVGLVVRYAIICRCLRNAVLRVIIFRVTVSSDTRPRGDQ